MRQGGCLSPVLFSILIDGLICSICGSDLGCHIGSLNFSILMYADDLVLLSASIRHLQLMIDTCVRELHELDLSINVKKSTCNRFGSRVSFICSSISVNNIIIPWSDNVKYLGITFNSGSRFSIDFKYSRSHFFRSFNSIYGNFFKANEAVIVSLVKYKCIPILK